jgi:subtilase family serine protease
MTIRRSIQMLAASAALATMIQVVPAASPTGRSISHNTPPYVSSNAFMKAEQPSKVIDVTIWLNLHNRGEMDALARDLYDSSSPNYRRWLNRQQIAARFAPTADEAATVRKFFESHNLKVVLTGNDNFFVRARGTIGDVQKAFHVVLNDYRLHGSVVRANDRDPYVEGAAAPLVRAIAGLDGGVYTHTAIVRSSALLNAAAGQSSPAAGAIGPTGQSADPSFYSSVCFTPGTQTLSTNNDGQLPIGTYTGEQLNLESLSSPGCAYTPAPIQAAYHLKELYAQGYTGQGQTIVIFDWCGSSTIESDANAFSKKFGLPTLDASNFQIIYTPTPSACIQENQIEINLDVEWAHAVAPGANIVLVVPPSDYLQDVDEAQFYAVNYGLGNSMSGSYGSMESETPASYLDTENMIAQIAAVSGISMHFSSGDYGDYGQYGPPTVNAPADSPWVTGVGGVSLALNADGSIAWQSGWGNDQTMVAYDGSIFDPPSSQSFGFEFGSGGGPSMCASQDDSTNTTTGAITITCLAGYPKPAFQANLPGKVRRVPDVSWLADPYTGVAIAITVPGQEPARIWEIVGGTSLACPMFSALWAIANQEAGAPLGQAAQYLYKMPAATLTDIVPVVGVDNVTATIQKADGIQNFSPAQLLGKDAPADFLSAFVNVPSDGGAGTLPETFVISFGTDCSDLPAKSGLGTPCTTPTALQTAPGWDDVTGVGTPNAQAFADYFSPNSGAAN